MQVLLIEDEPSVRRMTARVLERMGHEVVAVATGEEGVCALALDPSATDCVLVDLTLPDEAGEAVAARLRELRADLPLVIVSGAEAEDLATVAKGLVSAVALAKPFRVDELAAALKLATEH